jgi:hypothetical protein
MQALETLWFFWPLCCLFFFDIRILITPFGIFKLFLKVALNTIKQTSSQMHWSMSYLESEIKMCSYAVGDGSNLKFPKPEALKSLYRSPG